MQTACCWCNLLILNVIRTPRGNWCGPDISMREWEWSVTAEAEHAFHSRRALGAASSTVLGVGAEAPALAIATGPVPFAHTAAATTVIWVTGHIHTRIPTATLWQLAIPCRHRAVGLIPRRSQARTADCESDSIWTEPYIIPSHIIILTHSRVTLTRNNASHGDGMTICINVRWYCNWRPRWRWRLGHDDVQSVRDGQGQKVGKTHEPYKSSCNQQSGSDLEPACAAWTLHQSFNCHMNASDDLPARPALQFCLTAKEVKKHTHI